MTEKIYEKYAWILLLIVGIVGFMVGSQEMIFGEFVDPQVAESLTGKTWEEMASDPFIKFVTRAHGLAFLELSVLILGIAGFGYRKGEKWAWYVSWSIPAFLLGAFSLFFTAKGSVWHVQLVLTIVALLGILLSSRARKFFPRE